MNLRRKVWITVLHLTFVCIGAVNAGPPNDQCSTAASLVGTGLFPFDNSQALTDGPLSLSCTEQVGPGNEYIAHDVWYCWTSTCDGPVTVDTCGTTVVDTKISVYDRCTCPAISDDSIGCDNDACGFQSSVTFLAEEGESYLIQIGTAPIADQPALEGGPGAFTVTCGPAPDRACAEPATRCRERDRWNALRSDRAVASAADDFTPTMSGNLSQVCWWGAYSLDGDHCSEIAPDSFEVRYYVDAGGFPGALVGGPFSQANGTLSVQGPARTYASLMGVLSEQEYSATHAPVSVAANQCYWIEITNSSTSGCLWHWEVGRRGNERSLVDADLNGYAAEDVAPDDLAFCLNVPWNDEPPCADVPSNNSCASAVLVNDGSTAFDTSAASTDGDAHASCAFRLGDEQIHNDIWFDYAASCTGTLRVHTCGSEFDSKLALYASTSCASLGSPIGCNDDRCGNDTSRQSMVTTVTSLGQGYKIRVGGYDGAAGPGTLVVSCQAPPSNDTCAAATPQALPFAWAGDHAGASTECDAFSGSDVWIAFTLVASGSVTLEYSAAGDVMDDAWRGVTSTCGCTSFVTADRMTPLDNGGVRLTWDCLAAGTHYYPVVADAPVESGYEIAAVAAECASRCDESVDGCCSPHAGVGCGDPACCDAICGFDSFCCAVGWDALCADRAGALCAVCPGNACSTSTSDCFSPHNEPGCNIPTICERVCACRPYCCTSFWDTSCAGEGDPMGCGAADYCNEAAIPPTCEDGDHDCNGVINRRDHRYSIPCIGGPCATDSCELPLEVLPCCTIGDFNDDDDLDLMDHAAFQNVYDHP